MRNLRFIIVCVMIIATIIASGTGIYIIAKDMLAVKAVESAMQFNVEEFRDNMMNLRQQDVADSEPIPDETIQEAIPYADLLAAMQCYNDEICRTHQEDLTEESSYRDTIISLAEYGLKDQAIGVVSIPSIDVELPLYLGATERHMAMGFAQMTYTSMPIGGENTNSVLACHRGFGGAAFLRDVERIMIGDSVYIENPWEKLEYRVTGCRVIEPDDANSILIQHGKDMITLLTCHPFNVSTHRYLVYCERYIPEENPEGVETLAEESNKEYERRAEVGHTPTHPDNYEFESSQEEINTERYLMPVCLAIILAVCVLIVTALVLYLKKYMRCW